jgi:hypothetical protein
LRLLPLPLAAHSLQKREEQREPEQDPDVARPEGLAREAIVARVDERVDRKHENEKAQEGVDSECVPGDTFPDVREAFADTREVPSRSCHAGPRLHEPYRLSLPFPRRALEGTG